MKPLSVSLIGVALLALSFTALANAARYPLGPLPMRAADNLLSNPGFEGAFALRPDPWWGGDPVDELGVAEGWELWYDKDRRCPPYAPGCDPASFYLRPEFKWEIGTARVRSGEQAQKFFSTYGTHAAGFYQVVAVPPGSWVRFSIWVWTWSSDLDIPDYSFSPGDYGVTVGIDPSGGRDWAASTIVWGPTITRHDAWVQLTVEAYSTEGQVSVWTRGAPIWPVKHNDSYWDDAALVVLATPPPQPTLPPPTRTPYPTPEPTPPGYMPPACRLWADVRNQDFGDGQMIGWGRDAAQGTSGVLTGTLWLRNGETPSYTFPLAWLEQSWPLTGDLRIAFTFAYASHTAYGTSLGIGSEPYAGQRTLAGQPGPAGIEDILSIHHRATAPGSGEFRMHLLGQTVWTGTPGDAAPHAVVLELREYTYILSVDGIERGRGVSYWRPQSLYLGNPVVVTVPGRWTEVGLDDLRIQACGNLKMRFPLLLRHALAPAPTLPARLSLQ